VLGGYLRHYNTTMTTFCITFGPQSDSALHQRHLSTLPLHIRCNDDIRGSIPLIHSQFKFRFTSTKIFLSITIAYSMHWRHSRFDSAFTFIDYYDKTGSIPVLFSLFFIYFFSFVVTQINECDAQAEQPKRGDFYCRKIRVGFYRCHCTMYIVQIKVNFKFQ
jgi:hypothetical protein